MYLSRMTPSRPGVLHPQQAHKAVWRFFGEGRDQQPRNFLFRIDDRGSLPRFMVLSTEPPGDSQGWHVETKPFRPQLKTGDLLHFETTVNPVVRCKRKRHDVVMHYKKNHPDWRQHLSRDELVTQACERWFSTRSQDHGFALVPGHFQVAQFHLKRFQRYKKGEPSHRIHLAVAELSGLLTVTDPERFMNALGAGIGAGRAYGCGLLLVRRAS